MDISAKEAKVSSREILAKLYELDNGDARTLVAAQWQAYVRTLRESPAGMIHLPDYLDWHNKYLQGDERTSHEAVQALFVLLAGSFMVLTVIGVWFRGAGMALVWPWAWVWPTTKPSLFVVRIRERRRISSFVFYPPA